MNELNLRVSKFLRLLSMFMVMASLIYYYAYVSSERDIPVAREGWIAELPKDLVFYAGLAIFALINIAINVVLSMYQSTQRYDESSKLFRNEERKEQIRAWILFLLAGINCMLACFVLYMAFLSMTTVESDVGYIYFPIVGLIAVIIPFVGLIRAIFKRS